MKILIHPATPALFYGAFMLDMHLKPPSDFMTEVNPIMMVQ